MRLTTEGQGKRGERETQGTIGDVCESCRVIFISDQTKDKDIQ